MEKGGTVSWCPRRWIAKMARREAGIKDFASREAARIEKRFLAFVSGLTRSNRNPTDPKERDSPPVWRMPRLNTARVTAAIISATGVRTERKSRRMAYNVGRSRAGSNA